MKSQLLRINVRLRRAKHRPGLIKPLLLRINILSALKKLRPLQMNIRASRKKLLSTQTKFLFLRIKPLLILVSTSLSRINVLLPQINVNPWFLKVS